MARHEIEIDDDVTPRARPGYGCSLSIAAVLLVSAFGFALASDAKSMHLLGLAVVCAIAARIFQAAAYEQK